MSDVSKRIYIACKQTISVYVLHLKKTSKVSL